MDAKPSNRVWLTLDGWAVASAALVIMLIVVGALPRVPW